MVKLIKKDLLLVLSNRNNIIFLILYLPLINLILDTLDFASMISTMITGPVFILTMTSFAYDRTTKSHILMQSLPVKKMEIVISKYMAIFVNYTIGIILVGSYLWITSLFGSKIITGLSFNLIRGTLPILILGLSLSMPAQFKFQVRIANLINGIIMVIIMNVFMVGSNSIKDLLNIINNGTVSLLIISIIVYITSMLLSIWIYENRNFV